jgi:hypothetical protein
LGGEFAAASAFSLFDEVIQRSDKRPSFSVRIRGGRHLSVDYGFQTPCGPAREPERGKHMDRMHEHLTWIRGGRWILTAIVLCCTALVGLVPETSFAGGLGSASLLDELLPTAPADSFLVLVLPREEGEIRLDLEDARAAELTAGEKLIAARELAARAKARIDVKKSEIQTIKSREKLAKEQDLEAEKEDLKRQKKTKELELKLLEEREGMRKAEKELAEASKMAAQAQIRCLEREIELTAKRAEIGALRASGQASAFIDQIIRYDGEIRDTQRQVLDAMKELAGKLELVAKRQAAVIDRRLKVFEAQKKILANARG